MPGPREAHEPTTSDREELFLRFVNTNTGGQPEQFCDAAGLASWLVANDMAQIVGEVTDADAASARELRNVIQVLLLSHSSKEPLDTAEIERAEQYLLRIAPRYPLVSVVSVSGARLEPAQGGVPGLFALILASVVEIVQSGSWSRFKACQNPGCHWGFVDRTRSKTARYHAASCGSQVAMRAYRQRKRPS